MGGKKIYFETEEEVVRKKKGWIELETDYTQIYHNIFKYTKNITDKWAIKYLLWIITKTDSSNNIPHGNKVFEEFQLEYSKETGIPSEKSIREGITTLVKHNIFLRKGYNQYELNPRLFWQRTAKDREETILKYHNIGLDTEIP